MVMSGLCSRVRVMGSVRRPVLAPGIESDPTELTLARSAELARQRRQDRLLAEVAELRARNAELRATRADLQRQLDESRPDQRRMHASFATLGRQAVGRHLGLWAAAGRAGSVAVRLRPDDSRPAHTLQLEHDRRQDAPLKATVRDLPPGVQLDRHLQRHGTVRQLPALVHAVATEVDAFASRRRQVEELRAQLPARSSNLWHDPAVCDVMLQLKLNASGGERHAPRIPVELNIQYAPGASLPHQCRLTETHQLEEADREELLQLTTIFLRLPLREAFKEAFQ
ncbi:uncharacterized protein LOC122364021 isoform X1 [Amphibalanus amphitrite]|uniref:uncharacterized protein LOC122364021 isoform X1 n=2 Tax=Amphibalanus amphitrite TaxID=1232801 RepID=UPI001C90AEEE|nr:uncharacterized protein LOC122364021 isoform X1 [Amphibalanus amphitrite]